MRRYLRRMAVALVVSIGCYAGTEYWFLAGKVTRSRGGKGSVAVLSEAVNEVQRKEVKRVIWESVTRNDEFFPGEAIRTTEKAEAKIRLKSGAVIHLEPDSLVVLEENENGLALDFLAGNLFVQGGTSSADVTLKTGSGEIKLKSADMSLAKDQSGQVNLEVFKGQAELKQGSKTMDLSKDRSAVLSEKGMAEGKERLQMLAPQAGEVLLLNVSRGEKLEVSWKPIAPGYQVFAEVGSTRATLARVPGAVATGESGKLSVAQKPGKWFVRLTAEAGDKNLPQMASMTIPFSVEPKSPPTLISPANATPFLNEASDQQIEFRWVNRISFQSQVFELAKDALFKTIVAKQTLNAADSSLRLPVKDGAYFWRVTGFLKVKEKFDPVTSAAFKLETTSHLDIKPPVLLVPANFAQVPFQDAQKSGITLKWQAPPGVTRFKVLAQRKTEQGWQNVIDQETEATLIKISDVRPGGFQWKVTSMDPKGGPGKTSEVYEFGVDKMPKLEWAQGDGESEYNYITPAPTLQAQWKPLPTGASGYRFRVAPAASALEDAPWQMSKQNSFEITLKEDGAHAAVVEALNSRGQTMAQSERKVFNVKRIPLLPAPRWAENTPKVLKTDGKGNLSLNWLEVEGAKQYLMILETGDGKTIDERAVPRNGASLSRLKPGQYQIKLKAVDSHRRPSAEGEPRRLEVPNTSDIAAPKIKAMKVK